MSRKNTPELFWKRVAITDSYSCWNWTGSVNNSGYGTIRYNGICLSAHRLAYHLAVKAIPLRNPMTYSGADFVMHTCDNPRCCNPDHLKLGTHSDNMQDARNKNRVRSKKGIACLTLKQQKQVLLERSKGLTHRELALKFNVSKSTIGNFCQQKDARQGDLLNILKKEVK